jgi:hypothetical protein
MVAQRWSDSDALGVAPAPFRRYSGEVSPDTELVVLLGGLHLIGLAFVSMLLVMFLRSDAERERSAQEDDGFSDDGGGGSDRLAPTPPTRPGGGNVPLPDAAPARRRMRGPGRLADDWRPRRREPMHPRRVPQRTPVHR